MNDDWAVELNHVSKAFGSRRILDDVSFSVRQGEALCILGRSGTGKSVTLKLIIGLLNADSGHVRVASEDMATLSEKELSRVRRDVGYLFQSAALFDSFTIGDNLSLPLQRFNKSMSRSEVESIIVDRLRQVGLDKDKDKMPAELSGGMRKRAGLARAMVLNPKLLLVDEPSSGLDRITASEIDELLIKVKKERQTSMIVVTHDVRGARKLADKVAVLHEGLLIGFGTVGELEESDNEVIQNLISEA